MATTSAPSPSTLSAVTDAPTTLATPEANDPSVGISARWASSVSATASRA